MKQTRSAVVAVAAAIVLCGFAGTARAADDATADALFAKHKAYVGWAIGDGVVKTLRAQGHGVRDGKTIATMTELRYGVAYRDTYQATDGIESNHGFTGSVFWTSNQNGFAVRGIGEIVRYLADEQALFGERVSDYPGSIVRHETVEGVDTVLVHVTPQVGFPMNVWSIRRPERTNARSSIRTESTRPQSTGSATRKRPVSAS